MYDVWLPWLRKGPVWWTRRKWAWGGAFRIYGTRCQRQTGNDYTRGRGRYVILRPKRLIANIELVDIYCYICNDAKLDPDLATHLATFGINVQALTKTEKSMTELVSWFFFIHFRGLTFVG